MSLMSPSDHILHLVLGKTKISGIWDLLIYIFILNKIWKKKFDLVANWNFYTIQD